MSINLTTLFQVMPYAQNVAHAEIALPQAQQAAATLMAQENLQKNQSQVQKVEEQEGAESVKDENSGRKGGTGHRRRRKPPEPETAPESATSASNASPWSGNIINRRI